MHYVIILQEEIFEMWKPNKGIIIDHIQVIVGKVEHGEVGVLQSKQSPIADSVQLAVTQRQILNASV